MSNELTPEQTIFALYAEVKRLEDELAQCNEWNRRMSFDDNKLRQGIKDWSYHIKPCAASLWNNNEDCTCGLSDFLKEMNLL